jgi:hypothetical protein
MAHVKITVNGRPVDQWIDEEENAEIRQFYRAELGSLCKIARQPIASHKPIKNITRSLQQGATVRLA